MIKISGVKDFMLSQTLECGQCFHFKKVDEEEYFVSAQNKLLHISQREDELLFHNATAQEVENIWLDYPAEKGALQSAPFCCSVG